jgi:ankyrin repeat protein
MDGKEEGGDPAAAAAAHPDDSEKLALGFKRKKGVAPGRLASLIRDTKSVLSATGKIPTKTSKNDKRQRQSGPPPLPPKADDGEKGLPGWVHEQAAAAKPRPRNPVSADSSSDDEGLNQAKPPKRVKNEGSKSSKAARPNCAKLCNAAHRGQLPVVQGLLNKRSDANAKNRRGIPALNLATEQGHTAVMHLLLQHGASVAATDTNGNTALHYAAMQKEEGSMVNKVEATNLLLQHGGDAMAKRSNTDGSQHDTYTALHLAVSSEHVNTVRALLKHDSSAAAATDEDTGLTALHLAAQLSNAKLVQLLLEHDAPQDLTTKYAHIPYDAPQDTLASDSLDNPMRFTPLMFAAHAGGMECVRTLLSAGADATVRCPNYGTAERIAEEEGHSAIAALLRQHTAGGTASSAQHAGGVSVDHRLSLSRLRMDSLYSYGKRRREEIGGKEAGGDPAAAAAAHSAIVGPIVERRLAGMMSEDQRQKNLVPRLLPWHQCSYKSAYEDCGRPRDKQGAWANPIEAVARCFPQCFNIDQWKQALEKTAGGLKDKNNQLEHAGAACAHLWTAGWMFDLVNKVNATQYNDVM